MENLTENQSQSQTTSEVSKKTCQDCGAEFSYTPIPDPFHPGKYWLNPQACETCTARREEERGKAAEQKRLNEKARLWKSFCLPIFLETDLERLPQSQLTECLNWQGQGRSLLLHGTTGLGKTRIAWELLRIRFFKMGECQPEDHILVYTAAQFSRASSDRAANGRSEAWAKEVIRAAWLFIDDLGKGRLTERNESDLFDIFDQRFARKKPVIITTNTVGDELQKRLDPDRGEPLIRRLREFCDCIAF